MKKINEQFIELERVKSRNLELEERLRQARVRN
jgi:hypothetical protein